MSLPASAKYLVIGAGVHGLSTAWHLAKEQRARGEKLQQRATVVQLHRALLTRGSPND